MNTFICQHCNQAVFFDNSQCESCGAALGFDSDQLQMISLTRVHETQTLLDKKSNPYRACANRALHVCNWLLPKASLDTDLYCRACALNRYVPNTGDADASVQWAELEQAKKRLMYSLIRFGLPVVAKKDGQQQGLRFDFIDQQQNIPQNATNTIGHSQGQITITTDEANPSEREQTRIDLGEKYRTLLGHFRHEIGHYYWDHLVANDAHWLQEFRKLFGDDRQDYQQALASHYQNPNPNWRMDFISEYASSHPWEDWAETWAHYFHLIDTVDTALHFGIQIRPNNAELPKTTYSLRDGASADAYSSENFQELYDNYIPITLAVNSLNRSLGQSDVYPFVLNQSVFKKLDFIHQLIKNKSNTATPD